MTLPTPVEELQVKDELLKVMDGIYKVQRRKTTLNFLVFAVCLVIFFIFWGIHANILDMPIVMAEYIFPCMVFFFLILSLLSWGWRQVISRDCKAIVDASNPQCK